MGEKPPIMRLGELDIAGLPVAADAAGVEITGVTADSRAVRPGSLFAALKGVSQDGVAYVPQAVAAGARAILVAPDSEVPAAGVPVLRADDPRRMLSLIAARLYPRQPEHIVAVTGTSGKTSVAAFARQIFQSAGFEAGSIGTIGVVTNRSADYGSLTTPDPVTLHQTLDRLARDGVTHLAMEASSHGLEQRRLDGVRIVAAGFTNLGRDHMDYHPTIADYLAAKMRLFADLLPASGTAVVNADSPEGREAVAIAQRRGQKLFRVGNAGVEIKLTSVRADGFQQRVAIDAFGKKYDVLLPLAGLFQVSNALVAAGLAVGAGISADATFAALGKLQGAPGRLERVGQTSSGALIYVDYAHKPEAITSALTALRPFVRGRLFVIFGAGGDRDAGKRPLMGKAAIDAADVVIVTDDNPRTEKPAAIRAAILAGAPGAIEIPDRAAAIDAAIGMLQTGDVLCIAGKGHETGQIIGKDVLPFSDHAVVAAALARRAA
jgi:UDP-N-acetylmuramoyl-L-alanyl-D-glutamate--2,6-diaminopimelate ligase